MDKQTVSAYSGFYSCNCELAEPENTAGLISIIKQAAAQKRKVSFRGGGYSFDA